jgi:cellobiose-specific phosphotransferase system component IIB
MIRLHLAGQATRERASSFAKATEDRRGNSAGWFLVSQNKKGVLLRLRSKPKGISLRVMKVKEKKSAKDQVPFDPILFAVTVPSRQPTVKDRADAKERPDDAIEPKDYPTMDAAVKDL